MDSNPQWVPGFNVVLLILLSHVTSAFEVPLDPKVLEGLPQPPTITFQSPKDYIFDPREHIVIRCEAKGNPQPSFKWARNGTDFDVESDPKVLMKPGSGTLVIDISGGKAEAYEGTYQCTAENEHGKALTNKIVIRQSRSPLWPKERNEGTVVQKGVSLVLKCRPPAGLPPPVIFWMDNNFQKLQLDERVSQALNGDLYFSNVLPQDAREDYICYARFPHTQTIQQKQPISVVVLDNNPQGERRPRILLPSDPISTKMVLKGVVLQLECIAEGLPTPDVSWQKVGGELPNNRMAFHNFGKILQISDVNESDAGDYHCTAKNKLGSVHHVIKVDVKAAPFWISAPKNLILAPNETGILTCRVNGTPKPKVSWFVNGVPVENAAADRSRKVDDDTVIINNVQIGSSAVYQCNASNEFGYVMANAFVSVLAEPPKMLTPPDQVYQVITNSPAFLDCASFGSPTPTITWFKDGRISIENGDQYVIHKNGTLEITVAQVLNTGKYTCVATNNLGMKENSVNLEVKEPTRILEQPEYKVVQRGMSATFDCTVKHDKSLTPIMTWLKDRGELPDDERFEVDSDSLTIRNVVEGDAGTYTCIMKTSLDQDSASAVLTVVGKPDPPTDLELTDQTERSVQLTWTPGDENNSPIQSFLVQYEDSLHHKGVWVNLTEVDGTRTTTHLELSPYVYYSFRVLARNEVGYSEPSYPSSQYRTNPAAPDENPSNVRGVGSQPDNMVISWMPLTGYQANGPGLKYKVHWKRRDGEENWSSQNVVDKSEFVLTGTPTYVPYEIKVQALNDYGNGPDPEIVIGYSGEDVPLSAPEKVQVKVKDSTLAEVHWEPVNASSVRGQLQGYKVSYQRQRGLLGGEQGQQQEKVIIFSGDQSHGQIPDLQPFSIYTLSINVLNNKGEGPPSSNQTFETPEGVPGPPSFLNVLSPRLDSFSLEWGPPANNNGRLTGYTLRYQPVNRTAEPGTVQELNFFANETTTTLDNLNSSMLYKFYLSAKTIKGSGPTITEEASTAVDTAVPNRQVDIATQSWFIGLMCAIALLILVLLIVCFIKRNKGGKYPVKEKEDAHQDPEIQPMKEDDGTFGEYRSIESDMEDHKPLKGSRTPSNGTVRRDESDDSLVDYGEGGDGQFNEDGSFIGQYSGKKEKDTHEGNESSEAPSPVNAMNSFV
ncbi:neuronal cell adhesion molecule a isoform X16 [Oryzias melastigma]|uniref:neuronal cell adhesion molecule a isoform X16 n=1 Tax=Oryzias melastigma TaxID=30732 RepID=UPI00168CC312|nr:neuronal cell adhesion molecule a isoform X16 [Oryzias melastigma]